MKRQKGRAYSLDALAHGLWATAAAVAAKRTAGLQFRILPFALWATFPDVLAFGPGVAAGLWLRLAGGGGYAESAHGGYFHHVHIGLPLYAAGHSLLVFAGVYGLCSLVARRAVVPLLGWLLHILMDIPTHSYSYHATRFLWPLSNYGFDGVAWWTPWLLWCTYGSLALVYLLMWRKGWLRSSSRSSSPRSPQSATKPARAPDL